MPSYITIPDDVYSEAAGAIAQFWEVNQNAANLSVAKLAQLLRSYVYLGSHKAINDWSYLLGDDEKAAIATKVQQRTNADYSFLPAFNTTYTNLEIMETLASQGQVSPNVARPRAYQESFEGGTAGGYQAPDLGTTVLTTIQDFFGGAKKGLEAALKGLGIDLPLPLILAALVILVLVLLTKRTPA